MVEVFQRREEWYDMSSVLLNKTFPMTIELLPNSMHNHTNFYLNLLGGLTLCDINSKKDKDCVIYYLDNHFVICNKDDETDREFLNGKHALFINSKKMFYFPFNLDDNTAIRYNPHSFRVELTRSTVMKYLIDSNLLFLDYERDYDLVSEKITSIMLRAQKELLRMLRRIKEGDKLTFTQFYNLFVNNLNEPLSDSFFHKIADIANGCTYLIGNFNSIYKAYYLDNYILSMIYMRTITQFQSNVSIDDYILRYLGVSNLHLYKKSSNTLNGVFKDRNERLVKKLYSVRKDDNPIASFATLYEKWVNEHEALKNGQFIKRNSLNAYGKSNFFFKIKCAKLEDEYNRLANINNDSHSQDYGTYENTKNNISIMAIPYSDIGSYKYISIPKDTSRPNQYFYMANTIMNMIYLSHEFSYDSKKQKHGRFGTKYRMFLPNIKLLVDKDNLNSIETILKKLNEFQHINNISIDNYEKMAEFKFNRRKQLPYGIYALYSSVDNQSTMFVKSSEDVFIDEPLDYACYAEEKNDYSALYRSLPSMFFKRYGTYSNKPNIDNVLLYADKLNNGYVGVLAHNPFKGHIQAHHHSAYLYNRNGYKSPIWLRPLFNKETFLSGTMQSHVNHEYDIGIGMQNSTVGPFNYIMDDHIHCNAVASDMIKDVRHMRMNSFGIPFDKKIAAFKSQNTTSKVIQNKRYSIVSFLTSLSSMMLMRLYMVSIIHMIVSDNSDKYMIMAPTKKEDSLFKKCFKESYKSEKINHCRENSISFIKDFKNISYHKLPVFPNRSKLVMLSTIFGLNNRFLGKNHASDLYSVTKSVRWVHMNWAYYEYYPILIHDSLKLTPDLLMEIGAISREDCHSTPYNI